LGNGIEVLQVRIKEIMIGLALMATFLLLVFVLVANSGKCGQARWAPAYDETKLFIARKFIC
jgi:hypothetical protein